MVFDSNGGPRATLWFTCVSSVLLAAVAGCVFDSSDQPADEATDEAVARLIVCAGAPEMVAPGLLRVPLVVKEPVILRGGGSSVDTDGDSDSNSDSDGESDSDGDTDSDTPEDPPAGSHTTARLDEFGLEFHYPHATLSFVRTERSQFTDSWQLFEGAEMSAGVARVDAFTAPEATATLPEVLGYVVFSTSGTTGPVALSIHDLSGDLAGLSPCSQ